MRPSETHCNRSPQCTTETSRNRSHCRIVTRFSWSSNEMSTGDERVGPRKCRREGWPQSSSLNSGSSIDTSEDRRARHRYAASRGTHGSSYTTTFSRREERKICRSLRCKLLSNNGALLSRIERHLLHADHRGDGFVSVAAFKDALAEGRNRDGRGRSILHDEKIWLVEKLKTRNGKRVSIFNIRRLLESVGQGQGESHGRPRYCERAMDSREPEEAPPKWVIRQGTVGQWLHNVASPMVSFRVLGFPLDY